MRICAIYSVVAASKFTEEQIAWALKQSELCISEATFYNWKKKYGGLWPSELRRLRQPEEENTNIESSNGRFRKERLNAHWF